MQARVGQSVQRGIPRSFAGALTRSFLIAVPVLVLAVLTARQLPGNAILGLAVPAAVLSAIACARWPAAGTVGLFLLSGVYVTVRAYTSLPTTAMIDLVLVGLWLSIIWSYLTGRRTRPLLIWPGIAALALYVVLTFFEIATAQTVSIGLLSFRFQAWYMAAFLLIAVAPWSEGTLRRVYYGVISTALLVGAYCTLRSVIGSSGAELQAGDAFRGFSGLDFRFIGSFGSPQDLAEWMTFSAIFCFAQALSLRGRWRVLAAAAVVLCLVSLFASDIRIGLIATVAGCAVVLLSYQLSGAFPGPRIGIVTLAAVSAIAAGVWAFGFTGGGSEEKSQRYSAIFDPSSDYAYQQRRESWDGAFERAKELPFGQGIGTIGIVRQRHPQADEYQSSNLDSSYLKIALEQGFFVLAFLILSMLMLWFGLVRRAIVTADPARAGPAIGAAGVIVAMLVLFYIGDYVEGSSALAGWMLVGIGVASFTRPPDSPTV